MGSKKASIPVIIGIFIALAATALIATWISMSTRVDETEVTEENVPKANHPFLQEYVKKQDPEYGYRVLPEYTMRNRGDSFTAFVLNMTSHQWLSSIYIYFFNFKFCL